MTFQTANSLKTYTSFLVCISTGHSIPMMLLNKDPVKKKKERKEKKKKEKEIKISHSRFPVPH